MISSCRSCIYKVGILVSTLALGSTMAMASAKTLPKGVWKFDLKRSTYDYVRGGLNPSGDLSSWEVRGFDTLRMSDFPALQSTAALQNGTKAALVGVNDTLSNSLTTIDTNVPVANFWTQDQTHFNVAYGVNDKLTVFIHLTHEKGEVNYDSDYIQQSANIENNFELLANNLPGADGATNAALKAAYNQVPEKAISNHMRDTYIGFKYALSDRMAFTTRFSAGFLLTGVDSAEKKIADGVQELETGLGYDTYQFFIDYDIPAKPLPLLLTVGYFHNTQGPHGFLDITDVIIDYGDIIYLKAATEYKFHPTMVLEASLEHMITMKDKYKANSAASTFSTQSALTVPVPTTFTDVPNSAGYATVASFGLRVMPKEFLYFYASAHHTLYNKKTGQNYDFPGRLQPGPYLLLGTTLFFKAS